MNEKDRHVTLLTEEGVKHVERLLKIDNLYDNRHIETVHHVNQALKAHTLFQRDVDYIVKDGQVIIVDEFTGRLMPGTPLLRRPAPGPRGQGERHHRPREPDPGDDHLPELFPHVQEARRHDRYRGHGSG